MRRGLKMAGNGFVVSGGEVVCTTGEIFVVANGETIQTTE